MRDIRDLKRIVAEAFGELSDQPEQLNEESVIYNNLEQWQSVARALGYEVTEVSTDVDDLPTYIASNPAGDEVGVYQVAGERSEGVLFDTAEEYREWEQEASYGNASYWGGDPAQFEEEAAPEAEVFIRQKDSGAVRTFDSYSEWTDAVAALGVKTATSIDHDGTHADDVYSPVFAVDGGRVYGFFAPDEGDSYGILADTPEAYEAWENEEGLREDAGHSITDIITPEEARQLANDIDGGALDMYAPYFDKLYDWYVTTNQMPPSIASADVGEPVEWIEKEVVLDFGRELEDLRGVEVEEDFLAPPSGVDKYDVDEVEDLGEADELDFEDDEDERNEPDYNEGDLVMVGFGSREGDVAEVLEFSPSRAFATIKFQDGKVDHYHFSDLYPVGEDFDEEEYYGNLKDEDEDEYYDDEDDLADDEPVYEDDGEEKDVQTFYAIVGDDLEDLAVLMLDKSDSSYWHESVIYGDGPRGAGGKRYMSYLSPEDVMSWLRRDYSIVEGPYSDEYDATMEVDRRQEYDDLEECGDGPGVVYEEEDDEVETDEKMVVLVFDNEYAHNLLFDRFAYDVSYGPDEEILLPADKVDRVVDVLLSSGFTDGEDFTVQDYVKEAELQNGYNDQKMLNPKDYFPTGATSPAAKKLGPSAAKHGNNALGTSASVVSEDRLAKMYQEYFKG